MSTDAIVKTAVLKAPLARVWAAVSDARQFGQWFGVDFDGPFVAGASLTGRIQPTTVDPEVAALQAPHAGTAFTVQVATIDPPRRFAFRWHPYAVGGVDVSAEPMTLVTFDLEAEGAHTRVTITESGFDAIPLERRAAAFTANEGGWTHQLRLVGLYVERPADGGAAR
jgi:uncharacterized protein YndB with AHSA1/START domain